MTLKELKKKTGKCEACHKHPTFTVKGVLKDNFMEEPSYFAKTIKLYALACDCSKTKFYATQSEAINEWNAVSLQKTA